MLKRLGRVLRSRSKDTIGIRYGRKSFRMPRPDHDDFLTRHFVRAGGFYEEELLAALENRLGGTPGLALDCGANIGNHALFFSGVMGLETYAFEPVAANRDLLEKLVASNDVGQGIHIVPDAISDHNGVVHLACPSTDNPGMFRVSDDGEKANATTLDAFMDSNGLGADRVRLLKIDVEGHELAVLAGAQATISNMTGLVIAELASVAEFDAFSTNIAPLGFRPSAVYCATPTVVFSRDADIASSAAIRDTIVRYEAVHASA